MKKLLFISSMIIAYTAIYSQSITLRIENFEGKVDSVVFGFNPFATIGEDTAFGENNIYSNSSDEGVVVIQRDSFSYYQCDPTASTYGIDYYAKNFDSKVNFRGLSNLEDEGRFEFAITWDSLTSVKFISQDINIGTGTQFVINSDTCSFVADLAILPSEDKFEFELSSLINAGFIEIKKLKIQLVPELISSIAPLEEQQFLVFPNPAKQFINIESNHHGIKEIRLFTAIGELIYYKEFDKPTYFHLIETLASTSGIHIINIKFDNAYEENQIIFLNE